MTKKFTKKELAEFKAAKQAIQTLTQIYDGKKAKQSDARIIAITQRSNNEEWLTKKRETLVKLENDVDFITRRQQGSLLRSQTEEWKENHAKGMEQLRKNEKWKENKARAKMVPVITPFGIFPSSRHAGDEYNNLRRVTNGKNAVYKALKNNKEGYKIITREEYTKLTGKEL